MFAWNINGKSVLLLPLPPYWKELPGPSSSPNNSESGDHSTTYCYCREPQCEGDEMTGCDNSNCKIEWFHVRCLKIKTIPTGKWYCPTCRNLPEFKSRGKSKAKLL